MTVKYIASNRQHKTKNLNTLRKREQKREKSLNQFSIWTSIFDKIINVWNIFILCFCFSFHFFLSFLVGFIPSTSIVGTHWHTTRSLVDDREISFEKREDKKSAANETLARSVWYRAKTVQSKSALAKGTCYFPFCCHSECEHNRFIGCRLCLLFCFTCCYCNSLTFRIYAETTNVHLHG